MYERSPSVFKATVLPPAFGPLIISTLPVSPPKMKSLAITSSCLISGCLAPFSTSLSSSIVAFLALISLAYLALANL